MKRLIAVILAITSLLALASCGEKTLRTDAAVDELCTVSENKLADTETFATLDADYIKYMMEIDESSFTEGAVRQQASGRSADEYGIFKGADENSAKALGEQLNAYLNKRIETWNPSYDADQYPKIENAEVRVFGVYAVYCILSDADREAVFKAVESDLLG